MTINRRRFLLASASLPVLALIGCRRDVDVLPKELVMQTTPMKTFAVGRFLIDLPAEVNFSMSQRIMGMSIEWKPATSIQYQSQLALKVKELKGTNLANQLLISDQEGSIPKSKIILFEADTDKDGFILFEAYNYDEGLQGYLVIKGSAARTKISKAVLSINKVLALVQPRFVDTKTKEPGAWFDHALVKSNDVMMGEEAAIMATFNGILISFSTQVIDRVESTSLLDRSRSALSQFPEIGKTIKNLRQQKKVVAGLDGEEDCYKNLPESKEPFSHSFEWQYQGRPNSIAAPAIRMGFNVGGSAGKNTMSDAELLGLWDAIQDSIRLRPNSV